MKTSSRLLKLAVCLAAVAMVACLPIESRAIGTVRLDSRRDSIQADVLVADGSIPDFPLVDQNQVIEASPDDSTPFDKVVSAPIELSNAAADAHAEIHTTYALGGLCNLVQMTATGSGSLAASDGNPSDGIVAWGGGFSDVQLNLTVADEPVHFTVEGTLTGSRSCPEGGSEVSFYVARRSGSVSSLVFFFHNEVTGNGVPFNDGGMLEPGTYELYVFGRAHCGGPGVASMSFDVALTFDAAPVPAGATQIVGTGGNEELDAVGASLNYICGFGGDDLIFGSTGRDVILAGAGNDHVDADDGDDEIDLGAGNDFASGGKGADAIAGGLGDDTIFGDEGDDAIDGGFGADDLRGGEGNDVIEGGPGADTIKGGAGGDIVCGDVLDDATLACTDASGFASSDTDTIEGGPGHDNLLGGPGADVILGNAGDDFIEGNEGDDDLKGNGGRDKLRGGAGIDKLNGGPGEDVLVGGGGGDLLIACDGMLDHLKGNGGGDTGRIDVGVDDVIGVETLEVCP